MNGHNRIQMPNEPPPVMQQIQVAAPMNDIQLVAMMATHLPGVTAAERVELAQEIIAEAVVQQPQLNATIERLRRQSQT